MRDFQLPGRSPVYAMRGMAATSHPIATEAAVATLRAGGTAADAAVAAVAVLCVLEPHMVSPAGDCFWIVSKPGQKLEGYNGSGRAGAAAHFEHFKEQNLKAIGEHSVHAVTVPGAVDAWDALVRRHGKFGLDRLLQRAIEVAETGHPVAPRVALDWGANVHVGAKDPGFQAHYMPGGKAPVAGQVITHKALAQTYRAIAAKGARAMYEGEIAEDMVATLRRNGSLLTLDDFAEHKGEVVEPITSTYRGKTVAEIPPNGQGLTALTMLNIMETFDLARLAPLSAERFHIEIEAARIAYAMRDAYIAERQFMTSSPEALASKAYGAKLAAMIDMNARLPSDRLPPPPPENHTVYLTVVDENRMAVSFICSIFGNFGVGIATEKTGLLFQNRGSAFRVIDGHPNSIGPRKRPLHTIIPGMVLEGDELLASFGVMGGAYQACGHGHVLSNWIDYGMDPQEAIDAPRAFIEGQMTTVERGLPAATLEGLARRGHELKVPHGAIGGGQMIVVDRQRGTLIGGSDPRKDGCALGY